MERRFLITTAKYAAWRYNEPVVFLGEWCKIYSQKQKWESLDSKVASYRWDDRKQLFEDYKYLASIYNKLLPAIAKELNKIQNVNHSMRYWGIILGPWLSTFIQIIFERFHQIKIVSEEYIISGTLISEIQTEEIVPNDMLDFANSFISDDWNHHIYSMLIKDFSNIPYTKLGDEKKTNLIKQNPYSSKSFFKKQIFKILKIFHRRKDIVFVDFPLDPFNQLKLLIKYGCLIEKLPKKNSKEINVNYLMRKWEIGIVPENEFENILSKFIPLQIPILYLEGYQSMVEFCEKICLSNNPKSIQTSYITYNEEFKFWAADKIEKGTILNIFQHGGGYGIGKWISNEELEINAADNFYSWGWVNKEQCKVQALGILKANSFKERSSYNQEYALLILGTNLRYSYKLYSETISKQWLNYFSDQKIFINTLTLELRKKIKVKLYPTDYGWNDQIRYKEEFPEICFETGNASLKKLSKKSRVIISTYNSTTFLETLSLNIPSIIYWDPEFWELRDIAIPYFEKLSKVGVFHDSPVSAAMHLNKVWDDIFSWWNTEETQEAVRNFVQFFCYTYPDILNDLMIKINKSNFKIEKVDF
jgi:putative transferase (TIGR04331 family)